MLNIDLDDIVECYNPECRAQIDEPGPDARYCPYCGFQQVFACSSCPSQPGHLMRVGRDCSCPECGALHVYCAECWHPIPVSPDRPLRCPESCDSGVKIAREGTSGPRANVHRTGAVVCECHGDELAEPEVWNIGQAIVGRPVCRYGRLYLPTAGGAIHALDEDTGDSVRWWQRQRYFDPGNANLQLQVSERYVYFYHNSRIVACSAEDGRQIFALHIDNQRAACAICDDRLLVVEMKTNNSLRLTVYDTTVLANGADEAQLGAYTIKDIPEAIETVQAPTVIENGFLVRDPGGNIHRITASAREDIELLWSNDGYEYVSLPACANGSAYFIAAEPQRLRAEVYAIDLDTDENNVRSRSVSGVRPDYCGLRVAGRYLYFYDGNRDYYELDAAAWHSEPSTIFHGKQAAGDTRMQQLFVLPVRDEAGSWLFSLLTSHTGGEPYLVNTATGQRPPITTASDGPAAIAASKNHLFVTNPNSGEIFVYPIPCP